MNPNTRLLIAAALVVGVIIMWFVVSPGLFDQLDELERGLPTPTRVPASTPAPVLTPAG
jgi:hypothetical protein